MIDDNFLLESSVYHYYLWKEKQALDHEKSVQDFLNIDDDDDNDENTNTAASQRKQGFGIGNNANAKKKLKSGQPLQLLSTRYRRILNVLAVEFPHVASMFPLTVAGIPPEVYRRFEDYALLRDELKRAKKEIVSLKSQLDGSAADGGGKKRRRPDLDGAAAADFENGDNENSFSNRLAQLKEFKRQNMHCRVTDDYDPDLTLWTWKVRQFYQKAIENPYLLENPLPGPTELNNDRVQQLNEIGFEWMADSVAQYNTFEDYFTLLQKFQQVYGHCRVSDKHDPKLALWGCHIRTAWRQGHRNPDLFFLENPNEIQLTPDRISRLENIGFEFKLQHNTGEHAISSRLLRWNEKYEMLTKYKLKFGHTNVPRNEKSEFSVLGHWVKKQRQRYADNHLSDERIEKLNALGFVWQIDPNDKPLGKHSKKKSLSWEERIQQCIEFKALNGHLDVPPLLARLPDGSIAPKEELSFRLWAQTQRIEYRKKTAITATAATDVSLTASQILELNNLGFNWDGDTVNAIKPTDGVKPTKNEIFEHRLAQLTVVRRLFDRDFQKYHKRAFPEGDEAIGLHYWLIQQRKLYKHWTMGKKSSFTVERRKLIEATGFKLDPQNRRSLLTGSSHASRKSNGASSKKRSSSGMNKKKSKNEFGDDDDDDSENYDSNYDDENDSDDNDGEFDDDFEDDFEEDFAPMDDDDDELDDDDDEEQGDEQDDDNLLDDSYYV